jgi:hypothetical protein
VRRVVRAAFGTPFVIALGLLLTILPGAHAQDSGQDVFDTSAFDQNVQESKQQDQKAKLETQFGGNLLWDTSVTTTADFSGYGGGGSFSGKAFVKVSVPDYGAAYLAYNYSKSLYQGAAGTVPGTPFGPSGPLLSQSAGDLFGASYQLSEFYISLDIAQKVFFRIGNQLLAWGPSVIWTPVDFVNLQRVNPLATFDLRVGKPGARITVPMGISNLFIFADMSGTVTSGTVNDPVRTTNLAARWDLTVLGVELAVTGITGSGIQSQAGFDFSGRLLGFDLYGELTAGVPTSSWAFTWASSIGVQRTFGELSYWSAAGEFFYNDAGTSDISAYPALAAAQQFTPFYVGKVYCYAALTRKHLFIDGVSATAAAFVDVSDQSFLSRLSTSIDIPRVPPFTFSISWAGGGANKAFTYITGNNSLTAELQVRV